MDCLPPALRSGEVAETLVDFESCHLKRLEAAIATTAEKVRQPAALEEEHQQTCQGHAK
jgi:hypothetical protein